MPTFSGGVFLNVLTVAPKAGLGIEVDIYQSDGVTMLATMENAREVQFQDQRNQVGSGSFKLNRHDAKATSAILQRGNIVRVKLGGVYRFAYIIESITRTVVSKSGQGAEDVVVAGRGVLALIGRGALYPAGYPAAKVNPRTWSAVPFATVLDAGYTEALGRGCFPSVTRDWSASTDSLSRAWTDVQSPSLNVGTSLLDLAAQGASLGYDIGMSPTLVWHVWNATQGVDRSAGSLTPVIFRQGKHFGQEDFTDMIVDGPVITNMIVTGSGGLLLEVTDPALAAEPGIGRREGTFDYSSGQTVQDLSNAGNAAISHLQVDANPLQLTVTHGPSTNNGTITGDYEPYVDYFLGDTITIDAPPIYSLSNYVVEAFTIAQIADSEAYTVTMDLNSVFLDADILMWNKLGGASVGGSAGVSGLSSGGGTSSGALATVSVVQGDQPGYLDSKIAAGPGITTSLTGPLGNQQVQIATGDLIPLAWASGTSYGYGTLVLGSDNHTYVSLTTANTNHNPTTDGGVHWHDITTGGGGGGGSLKVPDVVQFAYAGATAGSVTIAAAPAGHTLILFANTVSGQITTPVCTNVTWTRLIAQSSAGAFCALWVGTVAGGSSGTTITTSFPGTYNSVLVAEVTDTLTGAAGANGSLSNAATNPGSLLRVTGTTAGRLLAMAASNDNTTNSVTIFPAVPSVGILQLGVGVTLALGYVVGTVAAVTTSPVTGATLMAEVI